MIKLHAIHSYVISIFFADSHQSYMSLSSNKKNCRMYSHLSLKNLDSEHIHTMDVMHHLNHILSK